VVRYSVEGVQLSQRQWDRPEHGIGTFDAVDMATFYCCTPSGILALWGSPSYNESLIPGTQVNFRSSRGLTHVTDVRMSLNDRSSLFRSMSSDGSSKSLRTMFASSMLMVRFKKVKTFTCQPMKEGIANLQVEGQRVWTEFCEQSFFGRSQPTREAVLRTE
jgi:hypothetical protein